MMRPAGILRILVAWIAILAYAVPGVAHAVPSTGAVPPTAVQDCEMHARDAVAPHARTHVDHDRKPAAHHDDFGRPPGELSHSCCVAMCTPALPAVDLLLPRLRQAEVSVMRATMAALESGRQVPIEPPPKS